MLYTRLLRRLVGIGLLLCSTPGLEAQLNRGIMEGTVTDPTGAFVAGVQVAAMSADTGVTLPTVISNSGYYRVVDLLPGKYTVHFEASGFSPLDLTDIVLPPGNETIRVDAELKLGATRQSIEASAGLTLVQAAPTDFSTDIGSNAIQQIPLQERDLQQLAFLVPGVIANGPPGTNFGFNRESGTFSDLTHLQGSDVSVNEGQTGTNAWYLDGNLNLSGMAESLAVNPSPDAVTELQTITNGFSAQYGQSGGAVFDVILKSGTNQLHGNAYQYVRNSYFDGRNPFTSIGANGRVIPQDQLRYNDFGGTLGGPVVIPHLYNGRNKTFFFSWDESILHLQGSGVFTVPTPSMRAGDFSEDPNVAQYGTWDLSSTVGPNAQGFFQRTALGTPAPGYPNRCLDTVVEANAGVTTCNFATQLPASMLSKTAMFFINQFPDPNYLNPLSNAPLAKEGAYRIAGNYLAVLGNSQDGSSISLKIDHQWSEKNRFSGEWLFNPGKYNNYRLPLTGATFPASSAGFGENLPFDFAHQIIALGNTYTFSPTLINEFRASFSRQFYTTYPEQAGYPDSLTDLAAVQKNLAPLGIPQWSPSPAPSWTVTAPGGGSMAWGPVGWTSNYTATQSYTILDNVTKLAGNHNLRTGFVYRQSHAAEFQSAPPNLNFNGVTDPITSLGGGRGLAQFMMGAVQNDGSSYTTAAWIPYMCWRYWAPYPQDGYRITPNFTLNLGLRWNVFGAYETRQHPESRFCMNCSNLDTGPPGIVQYEGDPGFPKNSDVLSPNWNDFGPRINFSRSPFSNRKTVIWGGYDVFFSSAYPSINPAQAVENVPGYAYDDRAFNSTNPTQCAPFSAHCLAWSVDRPGAKGPLTTPRVTGTFPAQQRDRLYTAYLDSVQKSAHDPIVQTWTLEVERQLPGNFALSIGYVGSDGTHLVGGMWHDFNYVRTADTFKYRNAINAEVPISQYYSGQTAQKLAEVWEVTATNSLPLSYLLRPNRFWGSIAAISTYDGNNTYHAFQVRVDKKYSQEVNFTAAYTLSKNIANPYVGSMIATVIDPIHFGRNGNIGGRTGALFGQALGFAYQGPDNVKADRALAFNDMPQVLNLAATYELPFGARRTFLNRKGPFDQLVGGWRLTGNFNAESGVPVNISGPCKGTCRPDLVGDPKAVRGGQNADLRINPAAFLPPFGGDQTFLVHPNPTDERWWQSNCGGRDCGPVLC